LDGAVLNSGDATTQLDSGIVTQTITIYAHTDDTLYSMDPSTKAVTLIGKFNGLSNSSTDSAVTDLAVNAGGEVYVNSESVIYKAAVPSSPGPVQLTKLATIALATNQRFYALTFAPAGVLGSGETLVGGDGWGELYSIDANTGKTTHLGNFGPDKANPGNVYALSGDIVFYMDANNKPTGLATIRSCGSKGTNCHKYNDYLAGIDMTALASAYSSGQPAASLLSGIYGGSTQSAGPGTHYGEIFGLGVWQGDVFGFTREYSGDAGSAPAQLLTIDTSSGAGNMINMFSFTGGWSGAGVTTKTTVTIPPPPPPPR
jgi:hypothetical protein